MLYNYSIFKRHGGEKTEQIYSKMIQNVNVDQDYITSHEKKIIYNMIQKVEL
jgi:hypothetical protein